MALSILCEVLDAKLKPFLIKICQEEYRYTLQHVCILYCPIPAGFSTRHMSILVLCCVALLLTLGLSVPTFNNLRKKGILPDIMRIYFSKIIA